MMMKVELYKKQNDVESAAGVIERLIVVNPLEGRYYAALAELYEANGETKKAEQVYKRAMNAVPDDPMIQLSLAIRSKMNQDSVGYSENLKKMAVNKSLDVATQLQVLDQYVQESFKDVDKRKEALVIAEQLAVQHPKDAQVAYSYGRVLVLNNQPEKAVEQYKRSLEIDQSNVEVWSRMLDIFTPKEKADSLKFYSDKALKLFPNLAAIHYYSGLAAYNKDDYPTAIKILNRAIDMLPEEDTDMLSRLYATLGELYNTTKEYKLSDQSYSKSLGLDPNNFLVLNNFAYFLSVRGENLEEAERMSRLSLELVPNEATFMDTYGWILYKQGKYSKAKEFIQKAIDKNGENADGTLYDHLGDVYFKLNEKEKALEYWQKAKAKGTDNPFIDKKIQEQKLYE
jgi:tetratricopeptide (TPR) repeat protein